MWTYFTDTDCDINPKVAAEYGYRLISMPYSIDARTIYPYEDFTEFDDKSFYDMLRQGTIPTTSAVGVDKYLEYFEPEFEKGNDIFYVHFSEAMSGTFTNMRNAVEILREKYPERKFLELDTNGITIVSYLIVREAGDMLKAGKTPEEVKAAFEGKVNNYSQYFFADDLKFFKKSGRVSGIAATMGGLIGIRPVIYMDPEGKMINIGKEKGRANALKRLISYAEEMGDDIKSHRIIIGHTGNLTLANAVADMVRGKFGDDTLIEIVITNPTAGCHCGPDGVGIAFHSKERRND
ncbi:MAG: DegV family protein [Bacteroidales bacterium]|nr:DegV family protein [Bacteroidales bacterium]